MSGLRICIAAGLLAGLSGTCVASQGVITFQGAIVEAPCVVSTSSKNIILQGCSAFPTEQFISARSVKSVRSIDGSEAFVKAIVESKDASNRRYLLADSNGRAIESGDFVVTVAYP